MMMRKAGEGLAVYRRKGRPIRQIESKKRTFYRRRHRLFKQAFELSVLCDAEVGAIIFSPSGKVSEFASSSTSHIVKRYKSVQSQMPSNDVPLQEVLYHAMELLEDLAPSRLSITPIGACYCLQPLECLVIGLDLELSPVKEMFHVLLFMDSK